MRNILENIAEINGWPFEYGRGDFQNLYKSAELKNTTHVFLDPVKIKDITDEYGTIEKRTYSGSFMLLYSSDIDELDYNSRYTKFIKPIIDADLAEIKEQLSCIYDAEFGAWDIIEVINMFDYNFDGIICNYQITLEYAEEEIETYTLTTEAGEGGEIIKSYTNEPFKIGSRIPLFVKANDGYLLSEIKVNDIVITENPFIVTIKKITKAVASFIGSIMLTITKEGYGSITPDVGVYSKIEGEETILTATPLDSGFDKTDSYFENFNIGGDIITDNPYTLVMPNAARTAHAIFKLWNIDNLLFNSIPIVKQCTTFFENLGSGQDAEVKNVRVAIGDGISAYIDSGIFIVGSQPIDYTWIGIIESTVSTETLLGAGGSAISLKGIRIYINGKAEIRIQTANGVDNGNVRVIAINNFNLNGLNTIQYIWDGVSTSSSLIVNGYTYAVASLVTWTGNSHTTAQLMRTSTGINYLAQKTIYSKLLGSFEYILNHGQGSIVYNLIGSTNGIITGANLAAFWGSKANNIESYELTLGATLYQNDSDQTIMPICFNTSQLISGFTRLGWFPTGSGILKGLPNTYTINGVDRDFVYLKALPITDYLKKTETDYTISYYKERSKDV